MAGFVQVDPIKVPPPPGPSDRTANMRANRRRDTSFELAIRSGLHADGLRFRVDYPIKIEPLRAFRVDVAFPRQRVAIQCDGCFWHGCPEHGRRSTKRNSEYWSRKIARNRQRDAQQDDALIAAGWVVLRFWEHEEPGIVIPFISSVVDARRRRTRRGCP